MSNKLLKLAITFLATLVLVYLTSMPGHFSCATSMKIGEEVNEADEAIEVAQLNCIIDEEQLSALGCATESELSELTATASELKATKEQEQANGRLHGDDTVAQLPATSYDFDYVTRVVAAECRGEPYEGQLAVAQTILERSCATYLNPEEVVKQSVNGVRQYAEPVAQELVTESVYNACVEAVIYGRGATDEPIQYFYSVVGGFYSSWHENNLEFVVQIGNHRFFKEALGNE